MCWIIPFAVAFMIFPLRESQRPLFETIMPITLTVCVVVFSILYFRKTDHWFLAEGVRLGVIWFLMSVVMDLLMFVWGPMKMTFPDYMADIGLTYLIYPTVSIGFGYLLEKRKP